jgi:anti-sigma B factor antagonist
MSLTIHQRTSDNVEILKLTGRLTLGEGGSALRGKVREAVERAGDLLVDLSGVTYIDSAGLGELVAGYAAMTASGRRMKLLRPHRRVDSMLQMTKLYTTFEVFEDEHAALASYGNE